MYPQMSHTFVLRLTCCFEKKNKADCVNVWKNVFLIIMKPGTDGSAYKCMFKDKYPNFEVGLKCLLMVFPYLLLCSYINENDM